MNVTNPTDLRVLLVEDSPIICNLVTRIINDVEGLNVIESVDTEADAIGAVHRGNVDVVILDLQLRTGTGFGVLRALRTMTKKPAVVVFTNFPVSTYRDSALALGATHFLDKSRDYDRLPGILTEMAAARGH
ncbi:MAG TPA: response regulator [Gemmatimonadaceae bacterium]|nr:response regulator [Gemmatimonadaceae bacterium]